MNKEGQRAIDITIAEKKLSIKGMKGFIGDRENMIHESAMDAHNDASLSPTYNPEGFEAFISREEERIDKQVDAFEKRIQDIEKDVQFLRILKNPQVLKNI